MFPEEQEGFLFLRFIDEVSYFELSALEEAWKEQFDLAYLQRMHVGHEGDNYWWPDPNIPRRSKYPNVQMPQYEE